MSLEIIRLVITVLISFGVNCPFTKMQLLISAWTPPIYLVDLVFCAEVFLIEQFLHFHFPHLISGS